MQHTIVLIEDDKEIGKYIQEVLIQNGYDCYVEETGTAGINRCVQIKPELVLLDLHLPDIPGTDVFNKLKELDPEIVIIMFTSQDTPESIARGLNIGADDYITKPVDTNVLLARLKARLRSPAHANNKLQVGDLTVDESSHEIKRGDRKIQLSAQEYKLLVFLMQNVNRVLTREMILSRIWHGSPDIETRVVDVYIGYLRKKIDFKEPKLIHSKRGFGYMIKQTLES